MYYFDGHDRYRVLLTHGAFVEMTKRMLEVQGTPEVTRYRHHGQDRHGRRMQRWDNAPHYPAIGTVPSHLHDGAEDHVVPHPSTTGLEALQHMLEAIEAQEQGRE